MTLQLSISDFEPFKTEIKQIVREVLEELQNEYPENSISGFSEVALKEALKKLPLQEEKNQFLSRKEVSQLLRVSLVTLNKWQKEGYLLPYKANKRVLYKAEDVENILKKTQPQKY